MKKPITRAVAPKSTTPKVVDRQKLAKGAYAKIGGRGTGVKLPRTGDALDRIISRPFVKWADYLDERQDKNAEQHVRAVEENLLRNGGRKIELDSLSLSQLKYLPEAIEESSVFDFESDPELSAVWRSIIESCLDNRASAEHLLKIVKETNPIAIRQLITVVLPKFEKTGYKELGLTSISSRELDPEHASALVKSGLLAHYGWMKFVRSLPALAILAILGIFSGSIVSILAGEVALLKESILASRVAFSLTAASVLGFIAYIVPLLTNYQLTRAASELVMGYMRYRK